MEFLYDQMQFIQKRWWILQGCLLAVLWIFLNDVADIYEMQRLMGAGACLFAIFLVPEIWKNRRNQAMEIEGAAYYSLRQVCMARILLFGFMDLLIVTAFAVSVVFTVRISVQMFAVNFLIPFNVTGAICFRSYIVNEAKVNIWRQQDVSVYDPVGIYHFQRRNLL
ncbi:MAG: hypothetical protein ACLVI9_06405 [Anaerostipes hadrus]